MSVATGSVPPTVNLEEVDEDEWSGVRVWGDVRGTVRRIRIHSVHIHQPVDQKHHDFNMVKMNWCHFFVVDWMKFSSLFLLAM